MSIAEGRRAERDRDSLAYLLRVVRRRWIVLVLSVAACVGIAIIASARSSKSYDSSSRVLFGTSRLSDAALQVDRSANDPEREAATNVLLARSEAVADNVRKKLGLSESTASLLEQVSAEAEENANIVRITVSDADPRRAGQVQVLERDEAGVPGGRGAHQAVPARMESRRTSRRWIGSSTAPHSYLYGSSPRRKSNRLAPASRADWT